MNKTGLLRIIHELINDRFDSSPNKYALLIGDSRIEFTDEDGDGDVQTFTITVERNANA